MPGNVRFDWHARVTAVAHEYDYMRAAADQLADAVARGDVRLGKHQTHARRDATDNLEGTYLVRLYAVFEAALRSYYAASGRRTRPPAEVLIDRVAAREHIPQPEIDEVHEVRLSRNVIVHEDAEPATAIALGESRGRLQAFLKRLPEKW